MTDPFSTATELAAAIRQKEVSSLELTDMYIDRIERYDRRINAVVVHDFERGRAAARAAAAALARGVDTGPQHRVPMTVKAAYKVTGLPTTWGVPELHHNIAAEDADYVRRLKAAGAVIFGKTNVPLNLGDFQSFNEIYGTTNNPWDLTRTPGGSSGGSSAALAAGLTALEAGSDIGGSIRNPAHFCGIYGHKPTWGIVSDEGHALPGMVAPTDIAVVGPMARCAEDLALSMDIVAGAGRTDRVGWQLNLPQPTKTRLSDFRVAILTNHPRAPVSAEMADRVQQIGDRLARLGATVSDRALPDIDLEESFEAYTSLLWGVMAFNLTEEEKDGLRQARAAGFADDSIPGTLVRFGVQEHGEWAEFSNRRFALRKAWQAFFRDWDILLCPQMATDAFPHDHGEYLERRIVVDNETQDYFQQVFWAGTVTVAHLPSTVFPTGPSRAGLPIGLQVVSGEYLDYTTIEFARLMAEEIGGFTPPPDFP
ncbi:MAG: amidase [Gammaproteobacteria bacterium]|nr:amidase [Gammaproteobacteria bacterium]